jgi:peptide/nickel transport system substrate-binding protein
MTRRRIGALFAASAILVAACGGSTPSTAPATQAPATTAPSGEAPATEAPATEAPSQDAGAPKPGGTLVVAIPSDIDKTDPTLISDASSSYVAQQVVETLVTLKPGTGGEIVPALATDWTVSEDGLTYTFTIRDGVQFHDGTPLDAEAVVANFDHWKNIPQSYIDASYTYYPDTVIGHGDGAFVQSVTATDASTVEVKLANPNSAFLVQLTLTPFGIQSPTALAAGNADNPDFSQNTAAVGGEGAMVGTGPFVFDEWVPDTSVTLSKNPNYWNAAAGGPYLDGISFRPIADNTATLNALQAGDIDLAQTIAPFDVPTVEGDANLQYFDRGSACNTGILAMQNATAPFDNLKIRQAVGYAIDRQALVDAFFGETGVTLENWVPPGTQFAVDQDVPDYDPEKAKALIAESGVTDLAFDFWYPSDVSRPYMPDPKGEAEAILQNLQDVGFQPNPKTAPWSPDYLDAEEAGQYPMWLIGWNCDWLGIDNFLYTAFFGYRGDPVGPNIEYDYKNDAMNQAMVDALSATDEATQAAKWLEAQQLIAADLPSLPLVSGKTPSAGQAYVKGVIPSPTLLEIFTDTWLDK